MASDVTVDSRFLCALLVTHLVIPSTLTARGSVSVCYVALYALLCYCATGAIVPHFGFFGGLGGWKLRLRPLRFFYVQL